MKLWDVIDLDNDKIHTKIVLKYKKYGLTPSHGHEKVCFPVLLGVENHGNKDVYLDALSQHDEEHHQEDIVKKCCYCCTNVLKM